MSYRLLCDEHVPESTVEELRARGFSARHVTEVPGSGSDDSTVARYARENGHVILTNDDDFLDDESFPDVRILYYPDNSVAPHTAS